MRDPEFKFKYFHTRISSVVPGIIVQNHLIQDEEESMTSNIAISEKHHQSLRL